MKGVEDKAWKIRRDRRGRPGATRSMRAKARARADASDGHNSGWAGGRPFDTRVAANEPTYWDDDINYWDESIGVLEPRGMHRLTHDFKSQAAFKVPARHIAIARHRDGQCEAFKAWGADGIKPPNDNTCHRSADSVCDDGGPGSALSECRYGTDMLDCGVREISYAGMI